MKYLLSLLLMLWALPVRAQIVPHLGSGDNSVALQTAFNSAAAAPCNYVAVPPGDWSFSNTLMVNTACAGYVSPGAKLHYIGTGSALVLNNPLGDNGYNTNRHPWNYLTLTGPGSGTSTTGLVIGTSNWGISDTNIQGFGTGIKWANYGFTDWFANVVVMNNGTNLLFPCFLPDAGENISFVGGTISNANIGLSDCGGEFNFDGVSFDALTHPIYDYAGPIRLSHGHIEKFGATPIVVTGQNSYTHVTVTDTDFLTDSNINSPLAAVTNGYAQFSRVFLSGFTNLAGLVTGDTAHATCESITSSLGSLDNVQGSLGICP